MRLELNEQDISKIVNFAIKTVGDSPVKVALSLVWAAIEVEYSARNANHKGQRYLVDAMNECYDHLDKEKENGA